MMSNKNRIHRNPDFRHRFEMPVPSIDEIEKKIKELLSTDIFLCLRKVENIKLRDRILSFSVIIAIVMSLVCRKIPSISEAVRVLSKEKLLWLTNTIEVTQQAISKRLQKIPARLFADLFRNVIMRIKANKINRNNILPGHEKWKKVLENFSAIWIADGSTLEALKKKTEELKNYASFVLGGKMMVIVEAFNHAPVDAFYTESFTEGDRKFNEQLLNILPLGGLIVLDLGFFCFSFFDAFTECGKFFVTRLKSKTAYKVIKCLSNGPRYREQIIQMGIYRSNPCEHLVRLVSVLWDGKWHHYITNVLDNKVLTAQQVCILYNNRWRIEDAFNLTKRLLNLSYFWVSNKNGVEIQIFATWIFYAVLNDICQHVALALQQPLQRISVEMVFRGFYHYANETSHLGLIDFLVENAELLSIVKKVRKRHKENDSQQIEIWGFLLAI